MGVCRQCMRQCGVERGRVHGYCNLDEGLYIASICRHYGEEPVLGGAAGVCNVFFAHCTLQCPFCQNYQISNNCLPVSQCGMAFEEALDAIRKHLDAGCGVLGFVTPTSQVVWVIRMVESLRAAGYRPTVVYNTNGLDSVETIARLEGIVDIYLPDYKYGSYDVAARCAGVRAYPDWALDSIGSMVRQVGVGLALDGAGLASRGVLVRHLVLPGEVENSRAALLNLRVEFGGLLTVSLMGQYTPTEGAGVCGEAFRRPVRADEYDEVLSFAEELGFAHILRQELSSVSNYMPDFSRRLPFGGA